ncbi:MAG: ABC transporter permease [Halobacteriales archaeon]
MSALSDGVDERTGREVEPGDVPGGPVDRLRANPRPAVGWAAVTAVLLLLELGALAQFLTLLTVDFLRALPITYQPTAVQSLADAFGQVPTLLSRDVIPNRGYWNGETYVDTFLGLPPAESWAIRATLIYGYAFGFVGWIWVGYERYRVNYRAADWTPRDDVLDRLRGHHWGLFGLIVVFMFVVMAVFAPALGPTTVQKNLRDPYSYTMEYWDQEAGAVEEITVGGANRGARSVGTPDNNVGLMQYDQYGRFHPFGTLPTGKDLFTFIAAGARISLIIGVLAVLLAGSVAAVLSLISAYYKGAVDLGFVFLADAVLALPQLLVLIMLSVVLAETWIGRLYSGGLVLGLIFAGTAWPILWRALRGPALQVSEREWIDAARSFGQSPWITMKKHMFPYITGYLLIYGSMTLGGAIIAIAGLSFLGLGVDPPTPEWGRAVNAGQEYVGTRSWHISLIPGALITLVVTGFNALGDGIRDAIDPQSDVAIGESAGRGGGG